MVGSLFELEPNNTISTPQSIDGGPEVNLTKQFIDHIFPDPGTYTVNVTVVDDYGLSNSTDITVYVSRTPDEGGGLIGTPQPFIAILAAVLVISWVRKRRN